MDMITSLRDLKNISVSIGNNSKSQKKSTEDVVGLLQEIMDNSKHITIKTGELLKNLENLELESSHLTQ